MMAGPGAMTSQQQPVTQVSCQKNTVKLCVLVPGIANEIEFLTLLI